MLAKVVGDGQEAVLAFADFMSANGEVRCRAPGLDAAGERRAAAHLCGTVQPYLELLLAHGRYQWKRKACGRTLRSGASFLYLKTRRTGFSTADLSNRRWAPGLTGVRNFSSYYSLDFADPSPRQAGRLPARGFSHRPE